MFERRSGAVAPLVHASAWMASVALIALGLSLAGLHSPADLDDGARLLPSIVAHRWLMLLPAMDVVLGTSLAAMTLA